MIAFHNWPPLTLPDLILPLHTVLGIIGGEHRASNHMEKVDFLTQLRDKSGVKIWPRFEAKKVALTWHICKCIL